MTDQTVERPALAHTWAEGYDTRVGLEAFWRVSALYRCDPDDKKWRPTDGPGGEVAATQGLGGTLILSDDDGSWLQTDAPLDVGYNA